MSAFKVGQRVRIIRPGSEWSGMEATVMAVCHGSWFAESRESPKRWVYLHYDVCVDGIGPRSKKGNQIAFAPCDLVPLTDPKAEEFIANLERLSREPQIASIPGTLHDYPVEAK